MTEQWKPLNDEDLDEVNGGINILSALFSKSVSLVDRTKTITSCPKCHQYREMQLSPEDSTLTCSCGYSWTVFI